MLSIQLAGKFKRVNNNQMRHVKEHNKWLMILKTTIIYAMKVCICPFPMIISKEPFSIKYFWYFYKATGTWDSIQVLKQSYTTMKFRLSSQYQLIIILEYISHKVHSEWSENFVSFGPGRQKIKTFHFWAIFEHFWILSVLRNSIFIS